MLNRLLKEERGSTLILAAISMMVVLAMAGLAIDGSLLYMTKSKLQKAANAAVLSGAQDLPNSTARVTNSVNYVINAHKEADSLTNLDSSTGEEVSVELTKEVPLTFARIFGYEKVDVKVHATAGLYPIGSAVGVAPLGIDETKLSQLGFYGEHQLKVGPSESEYGNFGILALEGPGAKTYEDNFRHGYQSEVKIGEIVDTQTGNIAEKTRDVVKERTDGCTQPPGDYSMRNCSRIIMVIVYKPHNYTGGQMKQVKVTGFAYFYIKDPMDSKDTSITGVFIKRTGAGSYVQGSANTGAYTIRLKK
ncbi:pilus assembly protein TadG-related protein [Neobacillus niacini]|uniref:pilus assembly protein TadG-related protein n=1 Tax=Neobacillus niacini TaxID=86668 RepID=UPI002FFF6DA2